MDRNQQFPNTNKTKKVNTKRSSTVAEQDDIEIVARSGSGSNNDRQAETQPISKRKVHRFVIGLTALGLLVSTFILNNSSTMSADNIQADGTASGISAGSYIVGATDDMSLQARDYTIEMNKDASSNRALIWDFAAEDGDVVTIKADGVLIAENIQIMHKPFVFNVPVPSKVEVIGVKDGGGGITYAVKIPGAVGNKVYFNAAEVGSSNIYTFISQP